MPLNLTRSILAIFIPGGVALAPWVLFLTVRFPSVRDFYSEYSTLVNFVMFGAIIVVGTIFETWGANFEKRWDDDREEKYEVKENWYQYLSRSIDPEPVGYRYISRAVTSLYFELTMIFGSFSFVIGTAAVASTLYPRFAILFMGASMLIGALVARFFRGHANRSHRLLCESRKEINERLEKAS